MALTISVQIGNGGFNGSWDASGRDSQPTFTRIDGTDPVPNAAFHAVYQDNDNDATLTLDYRPGALHVTTDHTERVTREYDF